GTSEDHQGGSGVEPQERGHPADPLLDQPAEEEAAAGGDVVADEELGIPEVPGEEQASPHAAERHPVPSLIRGVDVLLAAGIVELRGAPPADEVRGRCVAAV